MDGSWKWCGNSGISKGYGVAWNGTRWVAVGQDASGNSIAYSHDGITWYGAGNTVLNTGYGVAGNPGIGPVVVDSQLVLNNSVYGLSSNLDIVSDKYYNSGYTNFTIECNRMHIN